MIKLSPLGSFYLHASCHSRPCPLEALMLRGQPGHLPPTHPYCPGVEGLALREGRGGAAHRPQPLPPPPPASVMPCPNLSDPWWAAVLDIMGVTTTEMHLGNEKLFFFQMEI